MPKSKTNRRKRAKRKQARRALPVKPASTGPARQNDAEATITPARSKPGKAGG